MLAGVRSQVGEQQSRHRAPGLSQVVRNPFYVLGLTPAARRAEVALRYRALKDGLRRARPLAFETPHGTQSLDDDTLERAFAELRDPDLRLEHELRFVPAGSRNTNLQIVPTR